MNTNEIISDTVRGLAEAFGHRHHDIAKGMGRSPQFLSQKLVGRVGWSISDVETLGKMYGLSVIDFCRGPEVALAKLEREYAKLPPAMRPAFRTPKQRKSGGQLELEGAA